MLRNAIRYFLQFFPSISFVTAITLLYFPVPFLGWVLFGLAISSLISVTILNLFSRPISLLKHIDHLPKSNNRLLTPEEIEHFKKFANENDLHQLAQYEKFTKETCSITLSEMPEITDPITVQHKNESIELAKTYDKVALRTWISTKGVNAPEPLKRWYKLNDSNIKIYAGFPEWVQKFVKHALNIIKQNPKTKKEFIAEERGHFYEKNFKTLFSTKYQQCREDKPKPLFSPSIKVSG